MHTLDADRRLLWLILFLCAGTSAYFLGYALATNFLYAARELGPVQLYQLFALLGASVFFLWLGPGVPRIVGLGMSLLCSYFFLREADVREMGPDFWASFIDDRGFKTIWHAATAIAYGVFLWMSRHRLNDTIRYVLSRKSWPFWMSAAFLIAGDITERIYLRVWKVPVLEFMEETLEAASFSVLLVTALWFFKNACRPTQSAI